tara:strand:- start:4328 stop:5035 length:708 start_codon:yes stop_codon:yes gene_type:complete
LQNDTNTKILEVYAGSNKTQIVGNKLLINCKEDYTSLSVKTFKMICKCSSSINFDVLVKIDCNILEYKNSYGLNLDVKKKIYTENYLAKTLNSKYLKCDYGGIAVSFVNDMAMLKKWAIHKNVKINYKRDVNFNFPFFCGKFYFLSNNFCEKIVANGRADNVFFDKNAGPAEDIYVGYVLNKIIRSKEKIQIFKDHINFSNLKNRFLQKLNLTIQRLETKNNFEKENCVEINTLY